MSFTLPSTPNLNQITTSDFVNYKGVLYPVNNVVSTTNNGGGVYSTTIQITVLTSNDTTLSLKTSDTTVQDSRIDANGVQHTVWKQTAKA